jgi:hypothetical protein
MSNWNFLLIKFDSPGRDMNMTLKDRRELFMTAIQYAQQNHNGRRTMVIAPEYFVSSQGQNVGTVMADLKIYYEAIPVAERQQKTTMLREILKNMILDIDVGDATVNDILGNEMGWDSTKRTYYGASRDIPLDAKREIRASLSTLIDRPENRYLVLLPGTCTYEVSLLDGTPKFDTYVDRVKPWDANNHAALMYSYWRGLPDDQKTAATVRAKIGHGEAIGIRNKAWLAYKSDEGVVCLRKFLKENEVGEITDCLVMADLNPPHVDNSKIFGDPFRRYFIRGPRKDDALTAQEWHFKVVKNYFVSLPTSVNAVMEICLDYARNTAGNALDALREGYNMDPQIHLHIVLSATTSNEAPRNFLCDQGLFVHCDSSYDDVGRFGIWRKNGGTYQTVAPTRDMQRWNWWDSVYVPFDQQ